MHKNQSLSLRKAQKPELKAFYELMFDDEKWTKFNGPYLPYTRPTLSEFAGNFFKRLTIGKTALVIEYRGNAVGTVSFGWEDENTRWLEIGIAIYSPRNWSKGLGRHALILWVTHLFNELEIERVGLTTWSGNPRMMACALAIGMQQEARLRKVRYHQGRYYDSVKYGVLRSEWFGKDSIIFRK